MRSRCARPSAPRTRISVTSAGRLRRFRCRASHAAAPTGASSCAWRAAATTARSTRWSPRCTASCPRSMRCWRNLWRGGLDSMTELAPHQRSAAGRALELLDRYGGVLLADEVGLGKSYVAAAVARTMQERGYEVELIVPASLIAQWKDVLDAFSVTARVLTHDAIPERERDHKRRLIVVDEAHGFRNPRTQRWAALARRSVGARLMLVTATPVCNSADDLLSLIYLIAADDALRPLGVASIERAFAIPHARALDIIVSELVIRRDRDVLPAPLQFGELERRVIRHRVPDLAIDTLQFPLVGDGTHHQLLRRFLWRRLESSEAALLESLRRQTRFYERALDAISRGRTLTRSDYRRAFAADDESGALQQVLFWDFFATGTAAAGATEIGDEIARLDE